MDDAFCRYFVGLVPKIVERLMRFDPLVTENDPSDHVRSYFHEPIRCQCMQLPSASVALAGACLEQALEEVVPTTNHRSLHDWIEAARGSGALIAPHSNWAMDIQTIRNRVLHTRVCSDQDAEDAVGKLRGVIEPLHGRCSPA